MYYLYFCLLLNIFSQKVPNASRMVPKRKPVSEVSVILDSRGCTLYTVQRTLVAELSRGCTGKLRTNKVTLLLLREIEEKKRITEVTFLQSLCLWRYSTVRLTRVDPFYIVTYSTIKMGQDWPTCWLPHISLFLARKKLIKQIEKKT